MWRCKAPPCPCGSILCSEGRENAGTETWLLFPKKVAKGSDFSSAVSAQKHSFGMVINKPGQSPGEANTLEVSISE